MKQSRRSPVSSRPRNHAWRWTLWIIGSLVIVFAITSFSLLLSVACRHEGLYHQRYSHNSQQFLRAASNMAFIVSDTPDFFNAHIDGYSEDLRQQLMLPGNRTYTSECQTRYLYNSTWGKTRAPWADKVQSKELLKELDIEGIRIPRTLALFNKSMLDRMTVKDLELLVKELPSDFVLKPAHTSGAVARVVNASRYSCFKKCHYPAVNGRLPDAYNTMLKNMKYSIAHMHSRKNYERIIKGRQLQYEYIPKQIIIEEHLPLDQLDEWHFWVVDGQILFVCLRCGSHGSYFSTRFQTLNMSQGLPPCPNPPKQPPVSWNRMLQVVKEIGRHIPGVIRLDLYASSTDETIFFSEVTFTSTACTTAFEPLVADALIYATLHRNVTTVGPALVETVVNDRSCVALEADVSQWWLAERNRTMRQLRAQRHASPTDLCRILAPDDADKCFERTRKVATHPLQCIAVDRNSSLPAHAVGQQRDTNWRNVMTRVDWPWAVGLAVIIILLKWLGMGEEKTSQIGNVVIYLYAMAIYKWQSTYNDGFFSPDSVWTTVVQSYQVFVMVHPLQSHFIALTHFATYWFEIAAWRAKTLRSMLSWYLMYELVASFVNEYSHHHEADDGVRCMRVLFIHTMKQYAVDDIVRAYLCAPFLTYGYLLPKMILSHLQWSSITVLFACGALFWRFQNIEVHRKL